MTIGIRTSGMTKSQIAKQCQTQTRRALRLGRKQHTGRPQQTQQKPKRLRPFFEYTVKNTGTRRTLTVSAVSSADALNFALEAGLAKSLDKLVVVPEQ